MFDHLRYVECRGVGISLKCDGQPLGLLSDTSPNLRWFEVGPKVKQIAVGLDNLQQAIQPIDKRLNMLASRLELGELRPVPRWRLVEVFTNVRVERGQEIEPGKWLVTRRRLAPQQQDTVTLPADSLGQIMLVISCMRPGGGNTVFMGELRFSILRGTAPTPLPENENLLLAPSTRAMEMSAEAGALFGGVIGRS